MRIIFPGLAHAAQQKCRSSLKRGRGPDLHWAAVVERNMMVSCAAVAGKRGAPLGRACGVKAPWGARDTEWGKPRVDMRV